MSTKPIRAPGDIKLNEVWAHKRQLEGDLNLAISEFESKTLLLISDIRLERVPTASGRGVLAAVIVELTLGV